jgi:hypothetical protein
LIVYSEKSIEEIQLSGEDKQLWKWYLQEKKYKEAIEVCRNNDMRTELEYVSVKYADALFAEKKYCEAAQQYALTSKPFEEIVLKFTSEAIDAALLGTNRLHVVNRVNSLSPSF